MENSKVEITRILEIKSFKQMMENFLKMFAKFCLRWRLILTSMQISRWMRSIIQILKVMIVCLWGLVLSFIKEHSGHSQYFINTGEVWLNSICAPFSLLAFRWMKTLGYLIFYQRWYFVARYNIKQVLRHALLGRMTSDGFPRVIAKDRLSESCSMMENPHTRAAD